MIVTRGEVALSENSIGVLKLVSDELRNSLMRIVEGDGVSSSVVCDASYDGLVGSRAVPLRSILLFICMYCMYVYGYIGGMAICMNVCMYVCMEWFCILTMCSYSMGSFLYMTSVFIHQIIGTQILFFSLNTDEVRQRPRF